VTKALSRWMFATAIGLGAMTPAVAQPFPNKSVTIISPTGPGSPQDTIIRAIAEAMTKDLGKPVIVENKPGASLTMGPAMMAASAKPDGYTVSAFVTTLVLLPQMQKMSYEPFKDFTYIAQVASFPVGVAVKADSSFKSWADVLAQAKTRPGSVSYGTPGIGTMAHLGMELIAQNAGIQITHVPHNSSMAIINNVMGGHVMLQVSGMEWKQMVEEGRMRLLVMLSAKRHPAFPNVPSISEFGSPFDVEVPMGFVGPKGMDPTVVRRLHDAFKKASEDPGVLDVYRKSDIDHRFAGGDELRKSLEDVSTRMRPVIEELGLAAKN
jgi:tripartite-type tricarboxylate transporter receptor subunit TctC